LKKGTLVVSVPNQRTKEWLEEGQLAATVREAANSAAGKPLKLVFRVKT
jgi:chromosomal replication initiation ATPase DnaA